MTTAGSDAHPTERNPPPPDDAPTKRGTKRSTNNDDDGDEAMDAKRQIRAARRLLQCPVCLDTFAGAVVECNACAQVFCESCLQACLTRQSRRCPLCRCDPTPARRNKPIERLVAMLPSLCPFELEDAELTRATAAQGCALSTCSNCRAADDPARPPRALTTPSGPGTETGSDSRRGDNPAPSRPL